MNQKAVRSGDWKLIIDGAVTRTFLFNVKADPGERVDLFARQPPTVRRLQQLLIEWERDVDADAKAFASKAREQ
jgi:arylsulfatase A-like enzyme